MTEADRIFSRFPPYIREYIFAQGWQQLRQIQLEAARAIFDSEEDLLLSSSTASGKTEAAFFPILTLLSERPVPGSISVLYIAPLKSLINDQFSRMEQILEMSGVPLTHWHGDVGASHKTKLLKKPEGILQITPESLESMLMNRSNDIPRLFCALQFVVIDEIHAMIGTDRGNQVLCLLSRLERLIGRHPRRVGLSATIGDLAIAGNWLSAGSTHSCIAPVPERAPLHWRLGMAHFYIQNPKEDQSAKPSAATDAPAERGGVAKLDAGMEFLYDSVVGRKALVFSNSREETEYVTATLRQIARHRGEADVFLIHHGNLSAALRENAEKRMKDPMVSEAVTCATVTLELGIDIGKLSRVAQMGAPTTVSALLQRLGRSGRRGEPPELVMVYREETPLPNAPLPELIPFELLRGIAMIDLYSVERFIEPPNVRKMPLSLALHQTLSILASAGELTPKDLAQRVLSLPPLSYLPKDTYRALLVSMINTDLLEMTEARGLIVGLKGEQLISSYKFYAVFKDSEDYTVRADSEEIGTITTPPPVGDRFALAGRVWEVREVDVQRRLIFVCAVDGKMPVSWPGDSGEIHTKVLLAMREVLFNDKQYSFLTENAAQRLENARRLAKNTGMGEHSILSIGGQSYVFFPWLGTRSFRTMRRFLQKNASALGIDDIQSEGCHYITFKAAHATAESLMRAICGLLETEGLELERLVGSSECPIYDKHDPYIPPELLREAYAADRLRADEILERFTENGGKI